MTSGNILVVDDDPALLRAYTRILKRAGYQVETASDGRGAEAALRARARELDLVITDVQMPDVDGIEVLRLTHELDRDLPVVVMTGGPTVETAVRAMEYGALRYLIKPVSEPDMLSSIGQAVGLRRVARIQREASSRYGHTMQEARERADLEGRFGASLGKLWMAFQPIVSWSRRQVYSFEALLRSDEPSLGRPDEIIGAAERLGHCHLLGRTIRAAVADVLADGPNEILAFVNLHPSDLEDDELYAEDAPLSRLARRVVLEVSERASLERVPDLRSRVEALRRLGYRIALDDFGAGYAGLSTLRRLQPEIIKLDMSLVRDIHLDGVKQTLVRSMVELSRQLGMAVVAEGVETAAERDTLVALGADLFQGYLFGRPGGAFPSPTWGDRPRGQSQEVGVIARERAAIERVPGAPALRLAPAITRGVPLPERGPLITSLAHELRTPLNAVIGFAQLLHDGKCGPVTDEQRQHLIDILAGGEQLMAIADDIIAVSVGGPEPAGAPPPVERPVC
jgi:EAL domain-containing protein (putative c-di-GMP-specific phosphodiesterase class I)/CheY-like chemotaxis protein